jgi:tetratricopeptide (TPR) repeat protein
MVLGKAGQGFLVVYASLVCASRLIGPITYFAATSGPKPLAMYLQKITIENIRSLQHFELTFPADPAGWHVIIGDNGAGKSTLIRAVSLGLIGPTEVRLATPNFAEWLRKDTKKGSVALELSVDKVYDYTKGLRRTRILMAKVNIHTATTLGGITGQQPQLEATAEHGGVDLEKYVWNNAAPGWFSSGFGPFRRFTGGDVRYDKIFSTSARLGSHLSVFGEDIALTEALQWLKDIEFKQLKAREEKIRKSNALAPVEEPRISTDTPDELNKLWQAARIMREQALYKEAELLLRRALKIAEQANGNNHRDVATSLNNLALLLQVVNRSVEAEPLLRRALDISEADPETQHSHLAANLNNLARLLQETNRLEEAEPLLRRALAIDEASLGPQHPTVAIHLSNLALLLQDANRVSEAEPLMRRALAINEAELGSEHPNVATNLNNLAYLLLATNRVSEAEPLIRRALAINEASLGPQHPTVATNLNNLARLLQETNRLGEAEPLLRRALAISEAGLGAEHPSVSIRLNNLARLLQETNRLEEAEPLLRRALAINEASLGPQHPTVAIHLSNLALLLQDANRVSEAEPLMRRALAINEAELGSEHPNVATDLNNLAYLLQATNRATEADELVRQYQAKQVAKPDMPANTPAPAPLPLPLDENAWLALRLRTFINESQLLPPGTEFVEMATDGPVFRDGHGHTVSMTQLSDGFRSILSLAFELLRQLIRVYGLAAVFPVTGRHSIIELPGVVLIDEVDAHLHPTWQTRIGQWFTRCFPRLQFIVTSHSPLICRAVTETTGSIWRLPTPGQGQQVEEVTGTERQRLRLGNVLDAYGTGLFGGPDVEQSPEATTLLEERARLSAREAVGKATDAEKARLRELRQLFSSVDAAVEY